jgi:hypothetical protein
MSFSVNAGHNIVRPRSAPPAKGKADIASAGQRLSPPISSFVRPIEPELQHLSSQSDPSCLSLTITTERQANELIFRRGQGFQSWREGVDPLSFWRTVAIIPAFVTTETSRFNIHLAESSELPITHTWWESPCLTRVMGHGSLWYGNAVAWASKVYPLVKARVGVVSGAALHLWHADIASRRHTVRYEALRNAQFDPDRDVEPDESGCWRWASHKPALHAALENYLADRRSEASNGSVVTASMGASD